MRFDIDRHIGTHSKRDGVTRAGVNFDVAPVVFDDNAREEGIIVNIVNKNMTYRAAHIDNCGLKQVVSKWALRLMPLDGHSDGIGFKWADPDGKIAPAVGFAQNNYAVLRQKAYADTVNRYTYHRLAFLWGQVR
jgi:hypothetical protein